MGAPAPHRAVKKIFSVLIYGKMCKCTPAGHFSGLILFGGLDLEVYLDGVDGDD